MRVFAIIQVLVLLAMVFEATPFSTKSLTQTPNRRHNGRTSNNLRDVGESTYEPKIPARKRSLQFTSRNLCGVAFVSASVAVAKSAVFGAILQRANMCYIDYPALSAVATCSVKGCLADVIAQFQNRGEDNVRPKFSFRRNSAYILYGGLFLGLMCEVMYNHVYPLLFGRGTSTSALLATVLFDNFISAPLVWLPPIYFVKAILYGKGLASGGKQFIEDVRFGGLMTAYWKIWIPVQSFNFWVIPSHLRVAFMAGVSFFWMIILSCLSSNKKQKNE